MIDILNLALPYFGLIFIGFACGKSRALRGDLGIDGGAAAGAERVRDRPLARQLDRTRLGRRTDRHLCIGHHADDRDVVIQTGRLVFP